MNWGDAGPGVTVNGDIRMTRLGRFLERTKLDELPQLWNILKGEMSFVGPRPESKRFAHLFNGEYKAVLRYVPGIFGPSQVQYRNEGMLYPPDEDPETYYCRVVFPEKAKLDTDYYNKAYFYSDIGWIIRGITVSIFWSDSLTGNESPHAESKSSSMPRSSLLHGPSRTMCGFWTFRRDKILMPL